MYEIRRCILLLLFSMIIGCSGGGGGSSAVNPPTASARPPVLTGVFNDSTVSGLRYETTTQSGLTNTAGTFRYQSGETVSFSLGGIQLGSTQGASQVSPLDLFNVTDLDEARSTGVDRQLTNILILLQSLDRDQNPGNGIDLASLDEDLASDELNFNDENFLRGNYRRIVNQHAGFYQSAKAALNHFLDALALSVTIEVLERELLDLDGDSVLDQIILHEYSERGNLSKTEVIDAVSDEVLRTTSYEYDEIGNLSLVTNGTTIESFVFHPTFGVLSQSTESNGEIISQVENQYDAVGNLVSSSIIGFNRIVVSSGSLTSSLLPTLITAPTPIPPDLLNDSFTDNLIGAIESGTLFDILGTGGLFSPNPISPSNISSDTSNRYDDSGNLTETISTQTFGSDTQINTTTFAYENNLLITATTVFDLGQLTTEITFRYDSEGNQESCERTVNGVVQDMGGVFFDTQHPNVFFPGALVVLGAASSLLATCSDLIEFDTAGRISRITQPGTSIFREFVYEYTYLDNRLTEIRLVADSGFSQVQSLAYSTSGLLIEVVLFRNDELITRRALEYKSLVLPGFP